MKKVPVIAIGVINILTGKTKYDWSIYDHINKKHHPRIALTESGSLLYGGCEVGAEIELIGNDSGRLLKTDKVIDECICVKGDLLEMLKKHNYHYYPIKAFKSRPKNNRKLMTSYSVK